VSERPATNPIQELFAEHDSVRKDWLVRFVEHRIGDLRIIRLIQKWRQHTSWSTSLRRATESSEPYVITALAQRLSGLYSHSAANAVAQLKS
jgi:hypothetical protein